MRFHKVGDTVLYPIDRKDLPSKLPDDARMEDYFR